MGDLNYIVKNKDKICKSGDVRLIGNAASLLAMGNTLPGILNKFLFFNFGLTRNSFIFLGSSWPNILFPKSYLNGLEIYKQIVSTFFTLAYLCKHLSQVQTQFIKSLPGSVRRLD